MGQGREPPGPGTSLPSCQAVSGERTGEAFKVTEVGGLRTTFPRTLRHSEFGLVWRRGRLSSLKTGTCEPVTAMSTWTQVMRSQAVPPGAPCPESVPQGGTCHLAGCGCLSHEGGFISKQGAGSESKSRGDRRGRLAVPRSRRSNGANRHLQDSCRPPRRVAYALGGWSRGGGALLGAGPGRVTARASPAAPGWPVRAQLPSTAEPRPPQR